MLNRGLRVRLTRLHVGQQVNNQLSRARHALALHHREGGYVLQPTNGDALHDNREHVARQRYISQTL